jgi:hypothetical protein
MKFSRKEDGYGKKTKQKQFRLSNENESILTKLGEIYNRSETDIINELLFWEKKKMDIFEENIKNIALKERVMINFSRNIGYYPIVQNNENPIFIGNNIINKNAYEYNSILVEKSLDPNYSYFVQTSKSIIITNEQTNIQEGKFDFTGHGLYFKTEKELFSFFEDNNIDPENIAINKILLP